MWTPNSLLSRKRALDVKHLKHAWYVSFDRLRRLRVLVYFVLLLYSWLCLFVSTSLAREQVVCLGMYVVQFELLLGVGFLRM